MTRALAIFTFAFFTLLAPSLTYAQTTDTQTASWEITLPTLLAVELSSPDANRRTDAMLQVIHYGRFDDGTIDWTPVVEPLLAIFENDSNMQTRQIAVAALHATEHSKGMSNLRRLAHKQTSPRVIRVAVDALVDFYGIESFEGDRAMARLAERGRTPSLVVPATAQIDFSDRP